MFSLETGDNADCNCEGDNFGFFPNLFPLRNCYVASIFTRSVPGCKLNFTFCVSSFQKQYSTEEEYSLTFFREAKRGGKGTDCPRDYFRLRLTSVAFTALTLTSVSPPLPFLPFIAFTMDPSFVLPPLLSNSWRKKKKKGWRRGLERREEARTRNPQ